MEQITSELLKRQQEQLVKLNNIVTRTIAEKESIIENLLHPPAEVMRRGDKISDKVARFGGSWSFIILFFIILLVWIVFNTYALGKAKFDPYPFILMNLILSCIAAMQAPIIMMSQNRQEEKDRKRSENDYLINLKAELEIREMQEKMDLLSSEQIQMLVETQAAQLEILQNLEKRHI
jgi:uncharacterized membrane protein